MRACTAAPIEVKYSTFGMYLLTVEMTTKKEWQKELEVLLKGRCIACTPIVCC